MNKRNSYKSLSTICVCSAEDYDCAARDLGPVFRGITLKVNFIIRGLLPNLPSPTTLQVVNNNNALLNKSCKISYLYKLSQTPLNHGCNEYRYTILGNNLSLSYCELYLRSA